MRILSKGQIGSLQLRNRIVMAPMNVGALNNTDGSLSDRAIEYFTERAKGGVGLIVTGAVRVTREFERSKDTIPLWMAFADHKIHIGWINELAERCHDYGTKIAVQLTLGGGRQAGPFLQNHGLAIGPSEIRCYNPPHKKTRQLTKDDILKILASFQFSANLIKEAGADAIQLHGHEGYLMDQFTMSLWNHRTDEYGGSLENRLRFSKEIIEAIKKGAGHEFPIIYRYGLSHFVKGGRSIEEGIEMAKLLEKYGASALDIDAGCYETWYIAHPPSTIEPGFISYLAEKAKSAVQIPVITSGKISYPDVAEKILQNNQADYISLGRPLIADAYWVEKVKNNQIEDIRPCIGCHEGCLKRIIDFKSLSCAVNPAAGNEKYLEIAKSKETKKILVIGGGVAGMEAARISALRGHKVKLIEKTKYLGGNFQHQYLPTFKNDYKKYISYLETQLEKLNVDVQMEHPFEENDYYNYKPKVVFVATGAKFEIPKIKGVKQIDIISPLEAFNNQIYKGIYAIIGGGLVGTEAAINIAKHGGEVILIEAEPIIAKDAFRPNREHLLMMIENNNVQVYTETIVDEIHNNILKCISNNEKSIKLKIDKVIFCTGMSSENEIVEFFNDKRIDIIPVGDCLKPGRVIDAVWKSYRIARLL